VQAKKFNGTDKAQIGYRLNNNQGTLLGIDTGKRWKGWKRCLDEGKI